MSTDVSRGLRSLAAAVLVATVGCREGEVSPRPSLTTEAGAEEERLPDQVIQSGTHVVTREGVKKALLEARRIAFYNLEGKVAADTMEVTFYDANGAPSSWLRARSGEIDQRTNDMIARGDVVVTSSDGTRIEGEELRYDAARDRILSDRPVVILQKGNRIRSQGVEADAALTNIRMSGSSAVLRSEPRVGRRPAAPAAAAGQPPPAPASAGAAQPSASPPPTAGDAVTPVAPGIENAPTPPAVGNAPSGAGAALDAQAPAAPPAGGPPQGQPVPTSPPGGPAPATPSGGAAPGSGAPAPTPAPATPGGP